MSTASNAYGGGTLGYPPGNIQQTTTTIGYCQGLTATTGITVLGNSTWTRQYPPQLPSGYMWPPKMEPQPQSAHASPRFVYGNAANFQRVEQPFYERPLVVDAWAQTTSDDFGLINDEYRIRTEYLQKENERLNERVQMLERELQLHSDLLNQIHATAALKTKHNETLESPPSHTPPATPHAQQQHQQQHYHARISPCGNGNITTSTATAQVATYTASVTTPPQIMNSMRKNGVTCVAHSESVKYTIISNPREKQDNQNVEPIEIHLAEEDGALNLNSSADSGRLEICLGGEQDNTSQSTDTSFKLKTENAAAEEAPSRHRLPPQSGILVKRRRENSQDAMSHELRHQQGDTKINSTLKRNDILNEQASSNTLRHLQDDNVMVSIGPNNTRVPFKLYESINWENPSIATRKLLMAIFDRQTLATHSMTGKPSPAFKGQSKPQKQRLDPKVTEDIVFVVTRRCKVSDKEVRNAITTKCADENKMMKLQLNKKNAQRKSLDKENQNYAAEQSI